MTEAGWLTSGDPLALLDWLRYEATRPRWGWLGWLGVRREDPIPQAERGARRARARKYRLFACACCRRVWHLLDGRSRQAVEMAERFADGEATWEEARASDPAGFYPSDGSAASFAAHAAGCAFCAGGEDLDGVTHHAALAAIRGANARTQEDPATRRADIRDVLGSKAEKAAQAALLRDVFGNPFRPAASAACSTREVRSLAEAAYRERSLPAGTLEPNRLAVLADALEEDGCAERDLLDHLRGPGLHMRGCWGLDLILEKP
jgi:hypothetical protein